MKAIIIFQKNRELGKVKTRLAATIGDQNALFIYERLVEKAHQNIQNIDVKKFLYFSDRLENQEDWNGYEMRVQKTTDLGDRMQSALQDVLNDGYKQVILLGTDCYELTPEIIQNAFDQLDHSDYVLGPAKDGGYYLIGSKRTDDEVFQNKTWSTETVFKEAIAAITAVGATYDVVDELSDVDVEEDLGVLKSYLI